MINYCLSIGFAEMGVLPHSFVLVATAGLSRNDDDFAKFRLFFGVQSLEFPLKKRRRQLDKRIRTGEVPGLIDGKFLIGYGKK